MHRVIALLLVIGWASTAAAQGPTEADRLFEEGRQLLAAGRASEACPKFEESQRLDPARGTLINIAACYEELGHLIEAVAVFEDVANQSRNAVPVDKNRLDAATKRIAELEVKIPRVSITAADGVTVKLNGVEAPRDQWADGIRVNPGPVAVEASADGFESWTSSVTTEANGKTTQVAVPALLSYTGGGHPDPGGTVGTTQRKNRGRVILGISVAGGGAVLFGISTVLALGAKGKYDDAIAAHCGGNPDTCDSIGLDETASARGTGNLATIVGGVGLAAIVGGVVLWLTAPSETVETRETRAATLVPQVSAHGAGVAVVGTF